MSFTATFITSAHHPRQFPQDVGREVAVAGRSNSGKSTAINALLARRNLARTSKTPGRTQLINFFDLGDRRRLVDLPGYGYARVSVSLREHWRGLAEAYFGGRRSLSGVMVTVDVRRGLMDLDRVMLNWAREARVPAAVLLTKADKLSRGAGLSRRAELAGSVSSSVSLVLFSAPAGTGVQKARDLLHGWLACSTDAEKKTPRVRDSGDAPGVEDPGMG